MLFRSIVLAYSDQGNLSPPSLQPLNQSRNDKSAKSHSCSHDHDEFRFKKQSPPTFDGDCRKWPEFRAIWSKYASTEYRSNEQRAWALRQCLKGKALELVSAVVISHHRAYDLMWAKLTDEYSDISLSIQATYGTLATLKKVEDGDLRSLVRFVNCVEGCYSQLGEVGQLTAITMTHIDELTDLLPLQLQLSWNEIFNQLEITDKIHPFSRFMVFLEEKRSGAKRLADRQEQQKLISTSKSSYAKKKSVFHTECDGNEPQTSSVNSEPCYQSSSEPVSSVPSSQPASESKPVAISCVMHQDSKHETSACREFLSLTIDEKYKMLKSQGLCFRCLGNHMIRRCQSKLVCQHCKLRSHHSCLCRKKASEGKSAQAHVTDTNVNIACNSNSRVGIGDSIFAVQKAQVLGRDCQAMLFFDNGASTTFITQKAAKKYGDKVTGNAKLDITTLGGTETNVPSLIYEIEFLTSDGSAVLVQAYGMEALTGPVSKFDTTVVQKLFSQLDVSILQMTSSDIDPLVGIDNLGIHPEEVVYTAGTNLKIKRSPFGSVLMGSHPELKMEPIKSSLIGCHCTVVECYITQAEAFRFVEGEQIGRAHV